MIEISCIENFVKWGPHQLFHSHLALVRSKYLVKLDEWILQCWIQSHMCVFCFCLMGFLLLFSNIFYRKMYNTSATNFIFIRTYSSLQLNNQQKLNTSFGPATKKFQVRPEFNQYCISLTNYLGIWFS